MEDQFNDKDELYTAEETPSTEAEAPAANPEAAAEAPAAPVPEAVTPTSETEAPADETEASTAEPEAQAEEPETPAEEPQAVPAPDYAQQIADLTQELSLYRTELRELRKLYHNYYASVLTKREEELEHYHAIEKSTIHDDLLRELAAIYAGNLSLCDRVDDAQIAKQLRNMFSDLLQLMESFEAEQHLSQTGDPRSPRYCRIIHKVPTDDPELNDKVAKSLSPGFYIKNRPLIKEDIDVYVYRKEAAASEDSSDNI